MKNIITDLKRFSIKIAGENNYASLRNSYYKGFLDPCQNLSKFHSISYARAKNYKNRNNGQTLILLGNGPSLNDTDFSCVSDIPILGTNKIYLGLQRFGIKLSYYVSMNRYVIEQSANEINSIAIPKFLAFESARKVNFDEKTIFFRTRGRPEFSFDPIYSLYEGGTVTFVSLQIAYFLGFKRVLLAGIDHNFAVTGDPSKAVSAHGPDRSHFDPNYFSNGVTWQLPDLDLSENSYRMAKAVYENDGREIVDCTVGGQLRVFRKSTFQSEM